MTFVCFSANMDLQIIYLLHTINQSSDKIRFLHVFFINLSQLPAAKKDMQKQSIKTNVGHFLFRHGFSKPKKVVSH